MSDPIKLDQSKSSSTVVIDETIDKKNPNPDDPYQNFQGVGTTKDRVNEQIGQAATGAKVYEVNRDYEEETRIRRANMNAKQAEIDAPGSFTPEEAARIKVGLDPAKQAEVDAQTVEMQTKDGIVYKDKQFNDISHAILNFMADTRIGTNEKRGQLKNLRQQILSLEIQMDKGLYS